MPSQYIRVEVRIAATIGGCTEVSYAVQGTAVHLIVAAQHSMSDGMAHVTC